MMNNFRSWVQLLRNLPLLHLKRSRNTLFGKDLKPELLPSEFERVDKLIRYYKRYWLHQIGSRFSLFQKEMRTIKGLERFHANLKRKFKLYSPNLLEFIQKLNAAIVSTEKGMERIGHGL